MMYVHFTDEGQSERCTEQHTNKTVSIVGSTATSLSAGR